MRAEPDLGAVMLQWDVTALQVGEPGGPPTNIIRAADTCTLTAVFSGVGLAWGFLELGGATYTANFYAEGVGAGAAEVDLGPSPAAPLAPGGSPYSATLNVPANAFVPGTYKMSCVVNIGGFPGVTGFFEGPMIQVY